MTKLTAKIKNEIKSVHIEDDDEDFDELERIAKKYNVSLAAVCDYTDILSQQDWERKTARKEAELDIIRERILNSGNRVGGDPR